NAPVYRDMHVKGFLKFIAGMRGLKGKKADEAIDRAVSICHLEGVYYQSIDTLSKGYMRRTAFAQAILHDPPILILDEPTVGLDPNQKFEVRQMIRQMGKDKAIVISTHILEEVDACCTRALIIANGKILADGTPSELRAKAPTSNTVVVKLNESSEIQQIKEVISSFVSVAKIADLKSPESSIVSIVVYPSKEASPQKVLFDITEYFKNKNIIPVNLKIDEGRLDDVFREITTKEEIQR
ncbi:MAG TPA: ATP-binding cassette domain-containing protein, partial [Victivallales bacterium]|nr:ATP-binding cassette domain-containing protein [Victivallales bacterium]